MAADGSVKDNKISEADLQTVSNRETTAIGMKDAIKYIIEIIRLMR